MNVSVWGNFSQTFGNFAIGSPNIFLYNGGNSFAMNFVTGSGNTSNINGVTNISASGNINTANLSVSGALSIANLSASNLQVGNFSSPSTQSASLWAETNITGNIIVGGANTKMQFGYGNISLQILDGNVSIGNANGNGGSLDYFTSRGRTQFYMQPTGNSTTIDMYAANGYISTTGTVSAANLQISSNANIYANGYIDTVGRIDYLRTFGSFTSNATQTSAGANTVNYMTLNNTEDSNGVSIVSSSEITIARTGRYDIQFSAQLGHDTNNTANVEIWLTKNGNAIANTNTILTLTKDEKAIAAWDWLVNANTANDYFKIAWASSDTNVEIIATDAANTIANVAVPSLIVTVVPVGA
jgi:hypothetical protein